MEKCESRYCGCLFFSSNALARVITRMAEEEFAITGLAPSYAFIVMIVLEKPGIQPNEISREMQLTPSTITRLIEKLEHKGYLERRVNGKFTAVYPTDKTETIVIKVKEAWMNLYKRYSAILGEEEGKALTRLIIDASKKLEE